MLFFACFHPIQKVFVGAINISEASERNYSVPERRCSNSVLSAAYHTIVGNRFPGTHALVGWPRLLLPPHSICSFDWRALYRGFRVSTDIHDPETTQVRHAGTLGSGIDAAVLGVYVHCLLLSTGNILVPIVAHAVFDAILFVVEHVNVSLLSSKAVVTLCRWMVRLEGFSATRIVGWTRGLPTLLNSCDEQGGRLKLYQASSICGPARQHHSFRSMVALQQLRPPEVSEGGSPYCPCCHSFVPPYRRLGLSKNDHRVPEEARRASVAARSGDFACFTVRALV